MSSARAHPRKNPQTTVITTQEDRKIRVFSYSSVFLVRPNPVEITFRPGILRLRSPYCNESELYPPISPHTLRQALPRPPRPARAPNRKPGGRAILSRRSTAP